MTTDDQNLLQVPSTANGSSTDKRDGSTGKTTPAVVNRPVQPDGGWGWVVCFTSMACNGTVFGVINCFGILYTAMLEHYAKGDHNIAFKTSWVGSLTTGVTFSMCMLSSIVSDRFGMRSTGVVGGVLAFIGMLSSAFVEELMLLYLTYGIILGFGFACAYAPSLVILGHYFKRHIGLVNGLVTFGSSLFTISLALGLPPLLDKIGLRYTLIFLSGLVLLLVPYALTWKPIFTRENIALSQAGMSTMSLEMIQTRCSDCYRFTRKFLNVRIWRNKGYVIWALSLGISLFGYFVPFFHLVKYVKDVFPHKDGNILVMCISITSGVSRIVFGKIADFKWLNRIRIQQTAFVVLGIATLCIPFSESFGGLIALTLIMGICDGIFICLLGPIAFDIVGESGASQALGFLFGIFSVPMTVGPPVAGLLYDHMGTYNIAFHVAGCPPIIGALLMFFIPKTVPNVPAVTTTEEFAAISCPDIYHSNTGLGEEAINSRKVSSATPQMITMDDFSSLALINENDAAENDGLTDTMDTVTDNSISTATSVVTVDKETKTNNFNHDGDDREILLSKVPSTNLDHDRKAL
uniref:Major facilitator superfamily (MFS) profile domain-containing protein n=1 Tax=Arion vulgaris TaxID=1028688 RepID=A0A0B7AVE6_9EUPU